MRRAKSGRVTDEELKRVAEHLLDFHDAHLRGVNSSV